MKYYDIVEIMEQAGVYYEIEALDKNYKAVPEEWWGEDFLPSFEKWLKDLGILEWAAEGNDCDDLAWFAGSHARACQAQLQEPSALAVGMFNYFPEWAKGGKHSIPFAVVATKEGKKELRFADRKKNSIGKTCIQEVILSQAELESCFFWVV